MRRPAILLALLVTAACQEDGGDPVPAQSTEISRPPADATEAACGPVSPYLCEDPFELTTKAVTHCFPVESEGYASDLHVSGDWLAIRWEGDWTNPVSRLELFKNGCGQADRWRKWGRIALDRQAGKDFRIIGDRIYLLTASSLLAYNLGGDQPELLEALPLQSPRQLLTLREDRLLVFQDATPNLVLIDVAQTRPAILVEDDLPGVVPSLFPGAPAAEGSRAFLPVQRMLPDNSISDSRGVAFVEWSDTGFTLLDTQFPDPENERFKYQFRSIGAIMPVGDRLVVYSHWMPDNPGCYVHSLCSLYRIEDTRLAFDGICPEDFCGVSLMQVGTEAIAHYWGFSRYDLTVDPPAYLGTIGRGMTTPSGMDGAYDVGDAHLYHAQPGYVDGQHMNILQIHDLAP